MLQPLRLKIEAAKWQRGEGASRNCRATLAPGAEARWRRSPDLFACISVSANALAWFEWFRSCSMVWMTVLAMQSASASHAVACCRGAQGKAPS